MRTLRFLDGVMLSLYRRDWGAQPWAGVAYMAMMLGVMLAIFVPFLFAIWLLS